MTIKTDEPDQSPDLLATSNRGVLAHMDGAHIENFTENRRLTPRHGFNRAIKPAEEEAPPAPGDVHVTFKDGQKVNKIIPAGRGRTRQSLEEKRLRMLNSFIGYTNDAIRYIETVLSNPDLTKVTEFKTFSKQVNNLIYARYLPSSINTEIFERFREKYDCANTAKDSKFHIIGHYFFNDRIHCNNALIENPEFTAELKELFELRRAIYRVERDQLMPLIPATTEKPEPNPL